LFFEVFMKANEKGFTLVELLVTIGIMSFVMSLVFNFFIINFNNYARLNNESTLHFHSQYILNFISDKIMESRNIELIRSGTLDVKNSSIEYSISKISLRYGDEKNSCYIFEVRGNKIFYGNSNSNDSANDELGTYVSELKAEPYPAGNTFAETDALKLTLCLVRNGLEYEAEQVIYMRGS